MGSGGFSIIAAGKRESMGKKTCRIAALARLWVPFSNTFAVAGVKVNLRIVREEPAVTISCDEAWQNTCNESAFDKHSAHLF